MKKLIKTILVLFVCTLSNILLAQTKEDQTLRLNLIYVDIPLLAKGYYSVRNNKIFGTVGPNLGLGLFGKSKTERTGTSQNTNEEHVIEWGSDKDEDYLKRLDLGLSVGAGIQVSDLEIGLNCQISLFNVSSFVNDGDKIRNRILALTLAYKFNQ